MTRIYFDDRATRFSCGECGAPVVLRIEKFDSWQQRGVERSRTHMCSDEASHAIGELAVR